MASASPAAPDTEQPPTAPTAQHKREMATLTKIQGFLKVEGTPYVVLSVDGPVDVQRLAAGLGMTTSGDAMQTLLDAAASPAGEGFVTTLPRPPAQQDQPDDEDDEGEDEDEPEAPAAEADPETKILTCLLAHGPSDARTISATTGVTGTVLGTTLVQLMNQNRIEKNGLAYAAI